MAETYTLDKKRLTKWLANVNQEILNVQFGEPQFRTGPPIHFEEGKAVPVIATLKRFEQAPTKKNFDAFIAQVSQDLGKATGEGFDTWGQGLFTKVDDDGKPAATPTKSFRAVIKDGFYDCFKVAHVSLDQKQVDLLAKAANRMAGEFEKKISITVTDQLAILVASMRKTEARLKEVSDAAPDELREEAQKRADKKADDGK